MKKKTIALLAGGVSSEREVSLNSGQQVYEALDKSRYDVIRYDPKYDLARLVADASRIDAALVILHGPHGEDGTIQGLLELLDIPYQGSGVLGSALAMNKLAAKQMYSRHGIPTPGYIALSPGKPVGPDEIVARLGLPAVVKPVLAGSSIGMSLVKQAEEMEQALDKAFSFDSNVLVEAYIQGTEITCGVLGNRDLEALPPIEIIPAAAHAFFDYEAKYTAGATEEICPARLDQELTGRVQELARRAHRALFCRGYSRTDMILCQGEFYVLETNTIPGMTPTSLFPQAARAAGISFSRLLDRLIELGIEAHGDR